MNRSVSLAKQISSSITMLCLALTAAVTVEASDAGAAGAEAAVKNFGQVDERFYRGAQPKKDAYDDLAALGIRTVIDLRNDPKDWARERAEASGLRYINIPMSDTLRPSDHQIDSFFRAINDPETGAFYVHCKGGRHRTGVIGAVYRIVTDGWTFDQVYAEMKEYDYYSRWGHGPLKKYVRDYCERAQAMRTLHSTFQ